MSFDEAEDAYDDFMKILASKKHAIHRKRVDEEQVLDLVQKSEKIGRRIIHDDVRLYHEAEDLEHELPKAA